MCKTCPLEGSYVFYTWKTNVKQKMNKQATTTTKTAELLTNISQDVAGGIS